MTPSPQYPPPPPPPPPPGDVQEAEQEDPGAPLNAPWSQVSYSPLELGVWIDPSPQYVRPPPPPGFVTVTVLRQAAVGEDSSLTVHFAVNVPSP